MNKILYFGCVASLSVQLALASDIAVDGCADVRILQDVVTVTSTGAVSFVRLKMGEELAPEAKVLNDAWERSYGYLEWHPLMLRLDKSFILAFEVIVHHPEELLHYRRIACAVRI